MKVKIKPAILARRKQKKLIGSRKNSLAILGGKQASSRLSFKSQDQTSSMLNEEETPLDAIDRV